jgi:hypothetical protein
MTIPAYEIAVSGSAVVPRRQEPAPLVYGCIADDELGSVGATYWARQPGNRTRPLTLIDMTVSTVTDLDNWLSLQRSLLDQLANDLGAVSAPDPARAPYVNFLISLVAPRVPEPLFFSTSALRLRAEAVGLTVVGISEALEAFPPDRRSLRAAAVHDVAFSPLAAEKCHKYPYNAIATPRYGQPPSAIAAAFSFGALLGGAPEYFTR